MKNNHALTQYDRRNWSPLMELRHEMDRWFDDFWGTSTPSILESQAREWSPACDVVEDQNHYMVTLEMAGTPKDQIKIEVLGNQLVVSGERKSEDRKKENGVVYTERRYGKFHRSFGLPAGLDSERIEANYEDGVLRILIPKAETEKPRQIKISSGNGTSFFGKLLGQSSTKEKEEERSFSDQKSDKMAS